MVPSHGKRKCKPEDHDQNRYKERSTGFFNDKQSQHKPQADERADIEDTGAVRAVSGSHGQSPGPGRPAGRN